MNRILRLLPAAAIVGLVAGSAQAQDRQAPRGVPESPYESITLQRRRCFEDCPVYTQTFRADGTATYVGEQHVDRIGTYSGQISGLE